MTLDLIIITYNREAEIRRTMELLIPAAGGLASIIVVDNDSKDGTRRVLEEYRDRIPNLKLIFSDRNAGVAGGRNIGISQARADVLAFLDDDAEFVEPDFTERILSKFEADPTLGALAVNVVNFHTRTVQRNEFPHWDKSKIQEGREFQACYFVGAGHAIRRKALDAAGPYPEVFFYSQEELYLCYKLIQEGYRILYTPAVTVMHRQAAGGRVTNNRKWFLLLRNTLLVNYKFLPIGFFLLSVPVWAAKVLLLCRSVPTVCGALAGFIQLRKHGEFLRQPLDGPAFAYVRKNGGRVFW